MRFIKASKKIGGGYEPFDQLAGQIDAIVEAVDMADEQAIAAAVAEIRSLFAAIDFMPQAFRDLLAGKNHLPVRKLRLNTLKPGDGFLRQGRYREHFFGRSSILDLAQRYAREQFRYSRLALNWKQRSSFRSPAPRP